MSINSFANTQRSLSSQNILEQINISQNTINFENLKIKDDLLLIENRIPKINIVFKNCEFLGLFALCGKFNEKAVFKGSMKFENCIFNKKVYFNSCTYEGSVIFQKVQFNEKAKMDRSIYYNNILIEDSTFNGSVDFEMTVFKNGVNVKNTKFIYISLQLVQLQKLEQRGKPSDW